MTPSLQTVTPLALMVPPGPGARPQDEPSGPRSLGGLPEGDETIPVALRRRALLPTDHTLMVDTHRLLLSLPKGVRPLQLPRDFPRIANALSLRWPILDSAIAYLDELLVDRRGGRRGFPPLVAEEIRALRGFALAQLERRDARESSVVGPSATHPAH